MKDTKFNFKTEYPPPFQRTHWDYKIANISGIRKSLKNIYWHSLLAKTPTQQGALLLLVRSFLPNKFVTVNGEDSS